MKYIRKTVSNKLDNKRQVFIIFDSLFKIIADVGADPLSLLNDSWE